MSLETCRNCERLIGHLEKAYPFEDAILCDDCHERLTKKRSTVRAASMPAAGPEKRVDPPDTVSPPLNEPSAFLCDQCGAVVPSFEDLIETDQGWLCSNCKASPGSETYWATPAAASTSSYRRKAKKKKNAQLPLLIGLNALMSGGVIYLFASGTLQQWMGSGRTETIVSLDTSEALEAVNRSIRDANRQLAMKQLQQACQTLQAARDRAAASSEQRVLSRLPELDNALAQIKRQLAAPAAQPGEPNSAPFASAPPTPLGAFSEIRSDQPERQSNLSDKPVPPPEQDKPELSPGGKSDLSNSPQPLSASLDPADPRRRRADAWTLLQAGKDAEADAKFHQLLATSPQDHDDAIAVDVCQFEVGDATASKAALSAIEHLHASSPNPTTATALARATLADNPARSAKILAEFLDAHNAVDEAVLNGLGTALVQCDQKKVDSPAVMTWKESYFRSDKKLEMRSSNGLRRWGASWVDAGFAQRHWDDYRAALGRVHDDQAAIDRARQQLSQLTQRRADVSSALRRADTSGYDSDLERANNEILWQQGMLQAAQDKLSKVAHPEWPNRIELACPNSIALR